VCHICPPRSPGGRHDTARSAGSTPAPTARRPGSRIGPAGCRARRTLAPGPRSARSLPRLPASQPSRAPRLPRASWGPAAAEPNPDASARHARYRVPGEPGPSRPSLPRGRPACPPPGRFHARQCRDSRGHEPADAGHGRKDRGRCFFTGTTRDCVPNPVRSASAYALLTGAPAQCDFGSADYQQAGLIMAISPISRCRPKLTICVGLSPGSWKPRPAWPRANSRSHRCRLPSNGGDLEAKRRVSRCGCSSRGTDHVAAVVVRGSRQGAADRYRFPVRPGATSGRQMLDPLSWSIFSQYGRRLSTIMGGGPGGRRGHCTSETGSVPSVRGARTRRCVTRCHGTDGKHTGGPVLYRPDSHSSAGARARRGAPRSACRAREPGPVSPAR
jgi:hypothetical protein